VLNESFELSLVSSIKEFCKCVTLDLGKVIMTISAEPDVHGQPPAMAPPILALSHCLAGALSMLFQREEGAGVDLQGQAVGPTIGAIPVQERRSLSHLPAGPLECALCLHLRRPGGHGGACAGRAIGCLGKPPQRLLVPAQSHPHWLASHAHGPGQCGHRGAGAAAGG